VYRREALRGIRLDHHGFLGIAELLGVLGARGAVFREYPTTLTVRVLGRSKMRIVRVILGHLGLLTRFARRRLASAIRRQVGLGRAGRAKAHAL
jgi:NAD kinase